MDERTRNMRLGLFTVVGFALLIAVLFFLGLSSIFTEKASLVTCFSESVQGLSAGSQVKYRGVPIGSVSEITIMVEDRIVKVDMEIELKHFIGKGSRDFKRRRFHEYLQREIPKGLRCRLEYAGITGMKYIDFDYLVSAGSDIPALPEDLRMQISESDTVYMPSVPSSFKDITLTVTNALEKLANVKFEEISEELERSLLSISSILADPAIKLALNRISDAAENLEESTAAVNRVLDEKKMQELVNNLSTLLAALDKIAEKAGSDLEKMDLPASSAAFRRSAGSVDETGALLRSTLLQLNRTLESIKMLTDYLSENPQALIRGRGKETLEK